MGTGHNMRCGFFFCISPAAFACSTKPRRNDSSSEWDVSRMLIVMSVKPTLTDELLKVNSALKSIFSVIEDECSGGQ